MLRKKLRLEIGYSHAPLTMKVTHFILREVESMIDLKTLGDGHKSVEQIKAHSLYFDVPMSDKEWKEVKEAHSTLGSKLLQTNSIRSVDLFIYKESDSEAGKFIKVGEAYKAYRGEKNTRFCLHSYRTLVASQLDWRFRNTDQGKEFYFWLCEE